MMQDFSRFCSEDRRDLAKPWVHEGWTYYCDNTIAVRTPYAYPGVVALEGSDKPEKLASFFSKAAQLRSTGNPLYLPRAVRESIFLAEVPMVDCRKCDGSGHTECSCCGQDTECPNCDGNGKCESPHPVVELAPKVYASRLVISKILDLPGLLMWVAPDCGNEPHYFEFDGGQGLLMGYRPPSRSPVITHEELRNMIMAAQALGNTEGVR